MKYKNKGKDKYIKTLRNLHWKVVHVHIKINEVSMVLRKKTQVPL